MIPFNYHHLYYFYEIAKAGSISKACDTLYLAQSTLSAQIKLLEKSLGKNLFERQKQRLILTEEGRVVLDYAESIFEIGQEMQDTLNDKVQKIQIGILNGTPRSFGHALLEHIFGLQLNAVATVKEGNLDDLMSQLHQHKIDVILTDVSIHGQDQQEFMNHLIGKIPVIFAAAPIIAKKIKRIPADFDGAPFIIPSLPSQIYRQVLDLISEWTVKPKIIAEIQDVELARRMAVTGHGIVALNAYTVSVSLPKKSLLPIKTSKPLGIYESIYLVTRKRKFMNPIAEHVLKTFCLPNSVKRRP
jgi:LysR family transcriptional regulator, transcriptional activator of nhaA